MDSTGSTQDDDGGSVEGDLEKLEPVPGAYIWVYGHDEGVKGTAIADTVWLAGVGRDGRILLPAPVVSAHPDRVSLHASFPLQGRTGVFAGVGGDGTHSMTWFHHRVDGGIDVEDEVVAAWQGMQVRPTVAAGGRRHAFVVRSVDGERSSAWVWDAPGGRRSGEPREVLVNEEGFELRTSMLSDDGRWLAVQGIRRASNIIEIWLVDLTVAAPTPLRVVAESRVGEPDFGFAMDFLLDDRALLAWSDDPRSLWRPNWIVDVSQASQRRFVAHEINPPRGEPPFGPRCGNYPNVQGVYICGPNQGFDAFAVELIRFEPGNGLVRIGIGDDVGHAQYPGPGLTATEHLITLEGLPRIDDQASVRGMFVGLASPTPTIEWAPLEGDDMYTPWAGFDAARRGPWIAVDGREAPIPNLAVADTRAGLPLDRRTVYRAPADGSEISSQRPSWSPSGRYLFHALRQGSDDVATWQLYMTDVEAADPLVPVPVGAPRDSVVRRFHVCFDDLDDTHFIAGAQGLSDEVVFARVHATADPMKTRFEFELDPTTTTWTCLESSTSIPDDWPPN